MKAFDLKSLIAGVVLTMFVVAFTLIVTSNAPRAWEYAVVSGYAGSDYQNQINNAATNGWEVVSVATDTQRGPFAVMRRPKASLRPSGWKFWKK